MTTTRPGIAGLPDRVDQLALFAAHAEGIEAAFWKHHRDNPHTYILLYKFAKEAKRAGHKHFGAKMLWERLRWWAVVETRDPTGLKLNNNFTSRYSRLLMARERCSPECDGCFDPACMAGLFEVRVLDHPTTTQPIE